MLGKSERVETDGAVISRTEACLLCGYRRTLTESKAIS